LRAVPPRESGIECVCQAERRQSAIVLVSYSAKPPIPRTLRDQPFKAYGQAPCAKLAEHRTENKYRAIFTPTGQAPASARIACTAPVIPRSELTRGSWQPRPPVVPSRIPRRSPGGDSRSRRRDRSCRTAIRTPVHGAEDRRCGGMSGRVHKKRGTRNTPGSADILGARRGGGRGAVAAGRGGLPPRLGVYEAAAISEVASALQAGMTGTLPHLPLRGGLKMGGAKMPTFDQSTRRCMAQRRENTSQVQRRTETK